VSRDVAESTYGDVECADSCDISHVAVMGVGGTGCEPGAISRQKSTDDAERSIFVATGDSEPAILLPMDPDLASVIEAWPTLPAAVRAKVLAEIKSASEA
jgi:hypothetical protein